MTEEVFGPTLPISVELHKEKYRQPNESFMDAVNRIAGALADNQEHRKAIKDALKNMRWLPAGRVQSAVGSPDATTAFNCFVSPKIQDSITGIMDIFTFSALTMRMGGGIGYDFSTIRPRGDKITTLNSPASGPVSFMHIGDAVCGTVSSAGNRRGAQMGVLRIDHPDIEEFITAKRNDNVLTRYNISIGVTDEFMECLKADDMFTLRFEGKAYKQVKASYLWDLVMRSTWDWAEPGILFIDRINNDNNLYYCEEIAATNPCGEQPLPPNGACLLGSFNLVKYLYWEGGEFAGDDEYCFDWKIFAEDIQVAVRATDNVIDETTYPIEEQRQEALAKRRMGLGITGLANALEIMGMPYASPEFLAMTKEIMEVLRNVAYSTGVELAKEKGSFPLFDAEKYLDGEFAQRLPEDLREDIRKYGIRNSHYISIAPTGTISFCADNISSGCEPLFSLGYDRTIQTPDGPIVEAVTDYAFREYGVRGRTADSLTPEEHMAVQIACQPYVDSAISKTCNVGADVQWEEFKGIYVTAYEAGLKGITTFRAAGLRYGILNATEVEPEADEEESGAACFISPTTGQKECG